MHEGESPRNLHVLAGTTASGKSAVAHALALQMGAVVLSADSMSLYRGMDIGTAKPSREQRAECRYLGVDIMDPWEVGNVWTYRQRVLAQLAALPVNVPLVVAGGSGLYIQALTKGLDAAGSSPQERERWQSLYDEKGVDGLREALKCIDSTVLNSLADPSNPRRLIRALELATSSDACEPNVKTVGHRDESQGSDDRPVMAGLRHPPERLAERIERRVHDMYKKGLLDEVESLLRHPLGLSLTARHAIGYAEAIAVLQGHCSETEAITKTVIRTRRLAKRQRTWFRHQAEVHWVDVEKGESLASLAERVRQIWGTHGTARLAESGQTCKISRTDVLPGAKK